MRHLLIGLGVGIVTVVISIMVLANRDNSFETDVQSQRSILLNQEFVGANYRLTARKFRCGLYTNSAGKDEQHGCSLQISITNTTQFPQLLNLDGDKAIDTQGSRYESSDELSRSHIPDNGLIEEISPQATVDGEVFFTVPEGPTITSVEVYESVNTPPIVINL
jgi:hypothetical protein